MKSQWRTRVLGDVAEIGAGNSAPQAETLFRNGTYPFFRTADAGRIRFGDIYESSDYLNDDGIKGLRLFPKGTILFPKSGASTFLNHRVMLGVDGYVSSHLATIIADNSQIDQRFLLYFLSTISAQDLVQDHAYPSLNRAAISAVKITFPQRAVQQWIVRILDEAFKGIATARTKSEKNLQNARAIFESHLQSAFTQRGDRWVERRLGDVAKTQYGLSEPMNEDGNGYKIFRMGELQGGRLIDTGRMKFANIARAEFEKYRLQPGDILFNRTNSFELVGKTGIFNLQGDYCFASYLIRVLLNRRIMLPAFLNYFMNSERFQSSVKKKASRSINQANINATILANESVRFPGSLMEQRAIITRLDDLREEVRHLDSIYRRKRSCLDELRQSVLQRAFAGDLTRGTVTSNVVAFPKTIANITPIDMHAGILAIAYQKHEKHSRQRTFGHVKAEKIAHMIEAHVGIDLGRNPVKDAAGPNDYRHLKKVEHRAEKAGYFSFKQSGAESYIFRKLRRFDELTQRARNALGDDNRAVDEIIELMVPMQTQQAEIFTTVFAAWNNLLIDGQEASDEAIVSEARENWHSDKLMIPRERFFKAINWMRKKRVVPAGRGKKVISRKDT